MKPFAHFNARSTDEAVNLLRRFAGRAQLMAGGTDLLGKLKDRILPGYPEALINLKTIPGLDEVREEGGLLKIGALAILEDLARRELVAEKYSALALAARKTASPHIREMGTLGGNICQDIRCWYYRKAENRFPCLRKGGGRCYALGGDKRYHSIFGGSVEEGCIAVHPSDTAPALIALGAEAVTTRRRLKVEALFQTGVAKTTVLEEDEFITRFEIPEPPAGTSSTYLKYALRKAIDFPLVGCATRITTTEGKVSQARICLNAVFVTPYRAHKAEELISGQSVDEELAEEAAQAVVAEARPLGDNDYLVALARAAIKRTILECSG